MGDLPRAGNLGQGPKLGRHHTIGGAGIRTFQHQGEYTSLTRKGVPGRENQKFENEIARRWNPQGLPVEWTCQR